MYRSLAALSFAALSFFALTAAPAAPPPAPRSPPAPPSPPPPPSKEKLLEAENRAWAKATPALKKNCGDCHIQGALHATPKRLHHFNFTSYPLTGHRAKTIGFTVRKVLGLEGRPAIMPYRNTGTVKPDELALIKAWTVAWDAADQAGAHPVDPPAASPADAPH
jgi:mono/diheme cytochrome c family protein